MVADRMRVEQSELQRLDLRAHELLADVPLHDAWRLRLRGGGPKVTMRDVIDLMERMQESGLGPLARALFGVRSVVGGLLGWDRKPRGGIEASYVHRLRVEDRARSLDEPGSPRSFWTTIYTFAGEALGEVHNRTVHAFLLFALERASHGHTLYWAIYVKPVSRLTPLYMTVIDPFRRRFVYPDLIRGFERAWAEEWEGQ